MLDGFLVAPEFSELREMASEVLQQDVRIWWNSLEAEDIFTNAIAQFSIALYQIATWSKVSKIVPTPVVVAGYSIGELLAWHIAGAMDAYTTLRMVRERAALMDRYAPPHGENGCLVLMRGRTTPAMRTARERIIAEHGLTVAIYRTDGDLVLGGAATDVSAFLNASDLYQADLKRLKVSVPSHTYSLHKAVAPFRGYLSEHIQNDPLFPVLSGIDGSVLRRRNDGTIALSEQLARPLHWDWCVENLASFMIDVGLELGPGNDLAKQVEKAINGTSVRSVDAFASIAELEDWLKARNRIDQ